MSAALDVNRRVLPGFGLSLGYTIFYLSLMILVPMAAGFWKASPALVRRLLGGRLLGPRDRGLLAHRRGVLRVGRRSTSCWASLVAWVLVRYEFPLQAAARLARRLPVRAADGGRRPGLLEPVRRERLVRAVPGAARHPRRLLAARHRAGAGLHRLPVRRAHAAAGARRPRARRRGGRGLPRRQPLPDRSAR